MLAEKLPKYNLANLSIGHRNIYDIKANWKLVLENNVECYHCPGVHPELCEIHPTFRGGAIGQEALDGAPLIDGATTYSDTGFGPRPIISTLSEEDVAKFRSVTIYPNLFLGPAPGPGIRLLQVAPSLRPPAASQLIGYSRNRWSNPRASTPRTRSVSSTVS